MSYGVLGAFRSTPPDRKWEVIGGVFLPDSGFGAVRSRVVFVTSWKTMGRAFARLLVSQGCIPGGSWRRETSGPSRHCGAVLLSGRALRAISATAIT